MEGMPPPVERGSDPKEVFVGSINRLVQLSAVTTNQPAMVEITQLGACSSSHRNQ
jgi:hypothetical protein